MRVWTIQARPGGPPEAPDIVLVKPIHAGGARVGFAAALAHMTDIGGRIPGGNASDCAWYGLGAWQATSPRHSSSRRARQSRNVTCSLLSQTLASYLIISHLVPGILPSDFCQT